MFDMSKVYNVSDQTMLLASLLLCCPHAARHILSSSLDGRIRLWDYEHGKAVRVYEVRPCPLEPKVLMFHDTWVLVIAIEQQQAKGSYSTRVEGIGPARNLSQRSYFICDGNGSIPEAQGSRGSVCSTAPCEDPLSQKHTTRLACVHAGARQP